MREISRCPPPNLTTLNIQDLAARIPSPGPHRCLGFIKMKLCGVM